MCFLDFHRSLRTDESVRSIFLTLDLEDVGRVLRSFMVSRQTVCSTLFLLSRYTMCPITLMIKLSEKTDLIAVLISCVCLSCPFKTKIMKKYFSLIILEKYRQHFHLKKYFA